MHADSRETQQFFYTESYRARYGAEVEVRCNQLNTSLYKMAFSLAEVNI